MQRKTSKHLILLTLLSLVGVSMLSSEAQEKPQRVNPFFTQREEIEAYAKGVDPTSMSEAQAKGIRSFADLPVNYQKSFFLALGIKPGSSAATQVGRYFTGEIKPPEVKPGEEGKQQELIRSRVIAHVRFDDGKALPSAEFLAAAYKRDQEETQLKLSQKFADMMERGQIPIPEQAPEVESQPNNDSSVESGEPAVDPEVLLKELAKEPLPKLPRCPEDRTYESAKETDPLDSSLKDPGEVDWLILDGPVPNDVDVVFGKGTRAFQYGIPENVVASSVVAQQGLWCLPYRIRLSKGKIKHHLGMDALKNYDSTEEGVVHDSFKNRADQYR